MKVTSKEKIIQECLHESIELLKENSNDFGVFSSSEEDSLKNIIGRDLFISSFGLIASQDDELIDIARRSIVSFAKHQTNRGQIPHAINLKSKKPSFHYLGCVDSTLWWLIIVKFFDTYSGDKELFQVLEENIKKAIKWLRYQDKNNCGLLEECESTSWAEDMPVNGMVLYTNVLWSCVLKLYNKNKSEALAIDGLNNLFLPHRASVQNSKYLKQNNHFVNTIEWLRDGVEDVPYYLHYVSNRYASDRCDVYSNSMAVLFGIPTEARSDSIIRYLRNFKVSKKHTTKVLFPPIMQDDEDWRDYMDRDDCNNKPHNYQNGGIWPFVGGFYTMALKKVGKEVEAEKELYNLAKVNEIGDWGFYEWFDEKKGKENGERGKSINAGMFLFAYYYLNEDIEI